MPVTGFLDNLKLDPTIEVASDFIDDVDLRIKSLGYTLDESDAWLVGFLIQTIVNRIKNACNVTAVPDGLYQAAVNMVCGEFLLNKKSSGLLEGFAVDLDSATLSQVHEGDTTIAFKADGIKSPEERLTALIEHMINSGKAQFVKYRRLQWT